MATRNDKPQAKSPGSKGKPLSYLDQLIAQGKKPEDLTEEEKSKVLAEVDEAIENMTAEDVVKAVERGEIEVEYVDPPNPIDNFTEENFKKFLFGKITWAQLEGMTMEQAYAIAEFGYTMYNQGRYKDARTLFEGLVIGNPYDPYFHAMLGAIYTKLDMHEEAAQEFSIAIELDPEDINSYVNRGELLLQHGEFEYAMEDLKAAIDLDPEGTNPASLRARALAAATAAAIKELIDRKTSAEGAAGAESGPFSGEADRSSGPASAADPGGLPPGPSGAPTPSSATAAGPSGVMGPPPPGRPAPGSRGPGAGPSAPGSGFGAEPRPGARGAASAQPSMPPKK